jgi:hypothetical protein
VAQTGDYSQSVGRAAPRVPHCPYFPAHPDPYGSLTPAELAAFGIGPAHISFDDDDEAQADDDEAQADDDEEKEDDE